MVAQFRSEAAGHYGLRLLPLISLIEAVCLDLDMILRVEGLGRPSHLRHFGHGLSMRYRKLIAELLLEHFDKEEAVLVTLLHFNDLVFLALDHLVKLVLLEPCILQCHEESLTFPSTRGQQLEVSLLVHLWLRLQIADALLQIKHLEVVVQGLRSEILADHDIAIDRLVLLVLMRIHLGVEDLLAISDGLISRPLFRPFLRQVVLVHLTQRLHILIVLGQQSILRDQLAYLRVLLGNQIAEMLDFLFLFVICFDEVGVLHPHRILFLL